MTTTEKARAAEGKSKATGARQTRLSVNVNSATADALKAYAEENGVSITESVRRLVSYGNLLAEADREGKKVMFQDGDVVERVILID